MNPPYLQTDRLDLRLFTRADVDNLVALDSDPEVMRFITDGVPTPMEAVRDVVMPKIMASHGAEKRPVAWAAEDRANGVFLGWFHLRPFEDDERVLELGYRLMRRAWGRGLATEGSRALVELGFRQWGAHRIVAKTMRTNRASQRVMEKSGLAFDSDFVEHRFPGEDKAAVLYSLRREEFEARRVP